MDIRALKGKGKYRKGKGKGKFGKGKFKGKGKGLFGKEKGKGKGKGKGGYGKAKGKGKGKSKGKGKGTGCFIRGSQNHWSAECPQNRQGAIVEEERKEKFASGNWEENWSWTDENVWSEDWTESEWIDWTGAVTEDSDWSWDDWSWYEGDWADSWYEDWSGWNWDSSEVSPIAQQHPQQPASSSTLPSEDNTSPLPTGSRGHARISRPGLMSKLFVGALMLIGTLSSSVPVCPDIGRENSDSQTPPNLIESTPIEPQVAAPVQIAVQVGLPQTIHCCLLVLIALH